MNVFSIRVLVLVLNCLFEEARGHMTEVGLRCVLTPKVHIVVVRNHFFTEIT